MEPAARHTALWWRHYWVIGSRKIQLGMYLQKRIFYRHTFCLCSKHTLTCKEAKGKAYVLYTYDLMFSYQTLKFKKARNCGSTRGKHKRVSPLQDVQTGPRAHPASYSTGTGSLHRGLSGWDVKLTSFPSINVEVRNKWNYHMPSCRAVGQTWLFTLFTTTFTHYPTSSKWIYLHKNGMKVRCNIYDPHSFQQLLDVTRSRSCGFRVANIIM